MVEQYPVNEILNDNERIFTAWATVEAKDKVGEIIPMEEVKRLMPVYIERGAPLIDQHTNKVVGKVINYAFKEHPETKKEGLFITAKVFDHYDLDDQVWNEIKQGIRRGISFGGSRKKKLQKTIDGEQVSELRNLELYEFSTVREPANPYALNEQVNFVAKSENTDVQKPFAGYKNFEDCVNQNKDKDDPQAYCAAIMHRVEGKANKESEDVDKPEDARPPKQWWNKCIRRVKEGMPSYTDEQAAAVCGSMWFHEWGMGTKKEDPDNAPIDFKIIHEKMQTIKSILYGGDIMNNEMKKEEAKATETKKEPELPKPVEEKPPEEKKPRGEKEKQEEPRFSDELIERLTKIEGALNKLIAMLGEDEEVEESTKAKKTKPPEKIEKKQEEVVKQNYPIVKVDTTPRPVQDKIIYNNESEDNIVLDMLRGSKNPSWRELTELVNKKRNF